MVKRTVCIESPCLVSCRHDQLILRYDHIPGYEDRPERSVAIEDLGMVILEHQHISVTHYVLDALANQNVAVVVCNNTHHPSGMMLPLDSHSIQSERFRQQIDASEPLKKQLWQQTVKAKLMNQAAVLRRWDLADDTLRLLAQSVKSGDSGNNEAKGAVYYWGLVFPAAWNFFRQREGPPPNNLLNYGYAILRAATARSLVGAGLLPTLGIFHRNRYNAYCLADDIMEPYRPFVDAIVRAIIHETSDIQTLKQEHKVKLLNMLTHDTWIDGVKSPLMVALQKTANSLAKCYAGDIRKLAYPEFP